MHYERIVNNDDGIIHCIMLFYGVSLLPICNDPSHRCHFVQCNNNKKCSSQQVNLYCVGCFNLQLWNGWSSTKICICKKASSTCQFYLHRAWHVQYKEGVQNACKYILETSQTHAQRYEVSFKTTIFVKKEMEKWSQERTHSSATCLSCAICYFASGSPYDIAIAHGVLTVQVLVLVWRVVDAVHNNLHFDI